MPMPKPMPMPKERQRPKAFEVMSKERHWRKERERSKRAAGWKERQKATLLVCHLQVFPSVCACARES